jgi:hypothetical protein
MDNILRLIMCFCDTWLIPYESILITQGVHGGIDIWWGDDKYDYLSIDKLKNKIYTADGTWRCYNDNDGDVHGQCISLYGTSLVVDVWSMDGFTSMVKSAIPAEEVFADMMIRMRKPKEPAPMIKSGDSLRPNTYAGYWRIGESFSVAVRCKVTDEQIKNTETLLGWKWEDSQNANC